ncbi:MAG: Ig-like domain-containing protein [Gemmatirosa sp.]
MRSTRPSLLARAHGVPGARAALAAAALAALAACGSDSPVEPGNGGGTTPTLAIIPAAGSAPGLEGKQFSAAPGDTIRLSGRLSGATSTPSINWRSTDPAVAEVTADGLVRARAIGSASVIGSVESLADTLRVVVSNCGTTRALALAVGQVQAFDGTQGTDLCIVSGSASEEYVLIPYYATDSASRSLSVAVTASGIGATAADVGDLATAAPSTNVGPLRSRLLDRGMADDASVTDAPLHRRLRRHTDRELGAGRLSRARETLRAGRGEAFTRRLAPRARPNANASDARASGAVAAADLPTPSQVMQAVPRVGDLLRLNARTTSACDTSVAGQFRVGRIAAVTDRMVIVADTSNPRNGFTDAEYRQFALAFDTLAYPVDVANFGEPSDIDRNQRVIAFFTRAVNEETPRSADYVIGGFFWERDLFPNNVPSAQGGCAGSNGAELFYMLVPDPTGAVNGNVRSKTYVSEVTVGTLAHEFQHLINAARRIYVTDADDFEDVWLNEGLSHIAEELVFYRAAGFTPRTRLTASSVRTTGTVFDMFNLYGNDNLRRVLTYLRDTESRSPFGDDDDLETRGATWQFLRYAADRLAAGGSASESALWKKLVDNKTYGRRNLQQVLGTSVPLDDWFRDWTVANYVDAQAPALSGLEARFTHASWSYRSVLTSYTDTQGRPYALGTRTLANDAAQSVRLNGGSAAYLRFAVPSGRQATLRTRADAAKAGSLRLTVARTR